MRGTHRRLHEGNGLLKPILRHQVVVPRPRRWLRTLERIIVWTALAGFSLWCWYGVMLLFIWLCKLVLGT